jgi:glucosamine--fructose-6-phosphate aminotransferase (isomerizing)
MTTGTRSFEEIRTLSKGLLEAAEASQQVLKLKEEAKFCAQQFAKIKDLFFFGRGLDYSLSLEGSLKMKEITIFTVKPMLPRNETTEPLR